MSKPSSAGGSKGLSITGIDHVVLRVRDLDAAEALYRRLGFLVTPRGFHKGRGSANHTSPFREGGYIELIHYSDQGAPAHFAPLPEGPVAIAFAPVSSRLVHDELAAIGLPVEPPRDLQRPVLIGDREETAAFSNITLPVNAGAATRYFACQHLTRDYVWRPEYLDHPNGALALTEAILVAADLDEVAAFNTRLFGGGRVRIADDAVTVQLGDQSLTYFSPGAFARRYPDPVLPEVRDVWFAGIALRTADLQNAVTQLAEGGVAPVPAGKGRWLLPPTVTGGTLIEFR